MKFPITLSMNRSAALALAALLLAGCQGAVTLDLNADAPANPQLSGVTVDIAGVEFQRSDGGTEKLEFTTSLPTDLVVDVLDGDALRLFTDEVLADGTYTGVRLLLADNDDAAVFRRDGAEFPLLIAEGAYTQIDFTVVEDETSSESLALTLDLRKSLSFDEEESSYTLTPVLRAVDVDEARQIRGSVTAACPIGTSLLEGGAVYLFEGEDVDPDDIGGTVQPYATAAVASFSTQSTYALRLLPAGDYTIALTCNGNFDEPGSDDEVVFARTANVTVDEADVVFDIN